MKLTIISTLQNYWGGSEELWVRIANEAISRKIKVQCIFYNQKNELHPKLKNLTQIADSVILLPNNNTPSSLIGKGFNTISSKFKKNPFYGINEFNPDLILISQVHNYSAAFHPELNLFLNNTSYKYCLLSQFNHDYLTLANDDIVKAVSCIQKSQLNFFVSNRNKERTEHQLATHIDNSIIIDNPLNLSSNEYIKFPDTKNWQMASVARLECNFKRQDLLLEILASEKWKKRNWHLNLYGSGPDKEYLQKLISFYKLNSKITLHGQVASIQEVWKKNHILLLPSEAEGKPLALEEAMICGRTAVISDVAGNTELIDEQLGFIASSYFKKPFEEAMEKAWRSKDNWNSTGLKCHQHATKNFDLKPEKTVLNNLVKLKN